MKFNGKCKIRLLRDFPTINLRMGDSLTVYKYKYINYIFYGLSIVIKLF